MQPVLMALKDTLNKNKYNKILAQQMESGIVQYINALMSLQSTIKDYRVSHEEGMHSPNKQFIAKTKRDKLWSSLNQSLEQYFKEKINELYLRDMAKSIASLDPIPMPSMKPPKTIPKSSQKSSKSYPMLRYFCCDSAKYLGDIYTSLMRVLLIIRDNAAVFKFIGNVIDKSTTLSESTLDFIADDIVFFLLADFSSPENYAVHCLSQFKQLIAVNSFRALGLL